MPTLDYYRPTKVIIEIRLRDILPDNIKPKSISSIKLRFYRSEDDYHSFYCSVHIPNHKNYDGNALEIFVADTQEEFINNTYKPEPLRLTNEDDFDAVDEINAIALHDDDIEFNTYLDEYIPNRGYFYEATFDGSFEELPKRSICQVTEHGNLMIRVKGTAFYGFVCLKDYLEIVESNTDSQS